MAEMKPSLHVSMSKTVEGTQTGHTKNLQGFITCSGVPTRLPEAVTSVPDFEPRDSLVTHPPDREALLTQHFHSAIIPYLVADRQIRMCRSITSILKLLYVYNIKLIVGPDLLQRQTPVANIHFVLPSAPKNPTKTALVLICTMIPLPRSSV